MKNTNTLTIRDIIARAINDGKLVSDRPIKVDDRIIFKSAGDGNIYVLNKATNRAYVYREGIGGLDKGKQITLAVYKTQVDAVKQRVKAEAAKEERAKIAAWKKAHNEGENGVKPSVVDNSTINAPATKNAVLLDAERDDSRFDYRQGEDILSRTEAESYEETDSLLDEDKDDLTGYHRATFTGWASVKGRTKTMRDGSQRFYKPYVEMTFDVDGAELKTRAYAPQFNSFKIQANQKHRKLFNYMKDSVALNSLIGQEFEVWVKWNELLGDNGEFQAEFYDRAAYAARKRQHEIDAGSIKSGYSRIVEERATR